MRSFTTLILCFVACFAFAQQPSKKTYIISSSSNSPLLYNRFSSVDIKSGKTMEDLYDVNKKYSSRNNDFRFYEKKEGENDELKKPTAGSVACMAFDAKSNRLFYVPMQLSELRYMDLKESSPSFTYLQNQSLNLLHNKDDVANQISRMTIGADGNGYALSNDGEHLIKFTTQGTPVIQDLGVLIDNPKNTLLVRSSCTSWGGDIVGGADGSLYLVSVHNHVFKISLPSKKCDYIGTIKNLPQEFTSNGASVDENGNLLVSCGASIGKNFSSIYKVSWPNLEATTADVSSGIGNISDMASSNLLFQKPTKNVETSVVSFNQSSETDDNNLPGITIFPNPISRGKFQIRTSNMKEKGEYKMLLQDVNGIAIMEGKLTISAKRNVQSFSFPSQHAKGVYFVQVVDIFNRTIYSQQLIVE